MKYEDMNYEELSKIVRNNLVGLLASINMKEASIFAVICMLPKASQRYDLTDWIVNQIDNGKIPSHSDILAQAMLIEDNSTNGDEMS